MTPPIDHPIRRISDRYRAEDGTVTIEFIIVLPIFILLLTLIVDATLIFFGQANALRIVQDANRSFSVGRYTTQAEAEVGIENALASLSPNAVATSIVRNGLISSRVTFPASDLAAIGIITQLTNFDLSVSSEHLIEY